jgi:hypothetical protein
MRCRVLTILSSLFLLAACSSISPPGDLSGVNREQLVARMGQPETQRQIADETRLEFPSGPYGRQTWFVYLDAAGNAIRSEQVLTEHNFNQIAPGMDEAQVRQRLGRPGEVQALGRSRGVVWRYRFESPFCLWFQVEIGTDRKVRSSGYGEPPECDRPNEIIIPR